MPELPEVQVLATQLNEKLSGLTVSSIRLIRDDLLVSPRKLLESKIPACQVEAVTRVGKFIRILFKGHSSLWIHLGMTGQVILRPKSFVDGGYVQLVLDFAEVGLELLFSDIRKFGKIGFSEKSLPELVEKLGPDPFEMQEQEFIHRFKSRSGRIKNLLLNQTIVSGLDNIYADESLFRAMIPPTRRAHRLRSQRLGLLHQKIQEVLKEAIQAGGSSIDDFRHTNGQSGRFQGLHRVYGRMGKECLFCGQPIKRIVLGGRSAHFCPNCQK